MRWLGLAKRCVEIAREYAEQRYGFGVRLADRESVQLMLGDLTHRIEIGRLLVMKAAWELDQGRFAPQRDFDGQDSCGQMPPRSGRSLKGSLLARCR